MKSSFSVDLTITEMMILQDSLESSMIEILKDNTLDKENRVYCIGEREQLSLKLQVAYEESKANK